MKLLAKSLLLAFVFFVGEYGLLGSAIAGQASESSCKVIPVGNSGDVLGTVGDTLTMVGAVTLLIIPAKAEGEAVRIVLNRFTVAEAVKGAAAVGAAGAAANFLARMKSWFSSPSFASNLGLTPGQTMTLCPQENGPAGSSKTWILAPSGQQANSQTSLLSHLRDDDSKGVKFNGSAKSTNELPEFLRKWGQGSPSLAAEAPQNLNFLQSKQDFLLGHPAYLTDWSNVLAETSTSKTDANRGRSATVSGRVYSETGVGVKDAYVTLEEESSDGMSISRETDYDGNFIIHLPLGSYRLVIRKRGYQAQSMQVRLDNEKVQYLKVNLPFEDAYPCNFSVYNKTPWRVWIETLVHNRVTGESELNWPSPVAAGEAIVLRDVTKAGTVHAWATFSDHAPVDWDVPVSCREGNWTELY